MYNFFSFWIFIKNLNFYDFEDGSTQKYLGTRDDCETCIKAFWGGGFNPENLPDCSRIDRPKAVFNRRIDATSKSRAVLTESNGESHVDNRTQSNGIRGVLTGNPGEACSNRKRISVRFSPSTFYERAACTRRPGKSIDRSSDVLLITIVNRRYRVLRVSKW